VPEGRVQPIMVEWSGICFNCLKLLVVRDCIDEWQGLCLMRIW